MHEAVVTRTFIKLRNSFLFRFRRREEFLSFIPWVSHAVMIQQRNRNHCDTGGVQKSQKIKASTTTSRLHTKITIPLLNSVALANHDMRKTWCSGSGVYGAMLEVVRASEFSLPGIGVTV